MKLLIERSDLLSALSRVSGVTGNGKTAAILANVLITAGPEITFRANDLDMEATASAPGITDDAGAITLPAASLLEIARSLAPGAQVSIEPDGVRYLVKAGRSRWKLPALPVESFPSMGDDEWAAIVTMDGGQFLSLVGGVTYAASKDAARLAWQGVRLAITDRVTATALNGRIVARRIMDLPDECDPFAVTIPTRAVSEFGRMIDPSQPVTVSLSARKIRVEQAGASMKSKLLEEAFPNDDHAISVTDSLPLSFIADRSLVSQAIRRAMIGSAASETLVFTLSEGTLIANGKDQTGEGQDEVEIEYGGPDVTVKLTPSQVLATLDAFDGDKFVMRFAEEAKQPIRFEPFEDTSMVVVMGGRRA